MNVMIKKVRSFWYVINEQNEVVGRMTTKSEAQHYIERMDVLRKADEIDFDDMREKLFQTFDALICEKGYEFHEWNEAEWILDLFRRNVPEVYEIDAHANIRLCGNGWVADISFENERGFRFHDHRDYSNAESVIVKMRGFDDFGHEATEFLMNCESFGFVFDDYRKVFRSDKKYAIIGFEDGEVLLRLAEGKTQFLASVDYVKSMIA